MKLTHVILISILYTSIPQHIHALKKAVINKPIADLIGQPITTIRPHEAPHDAYNNIALCGGQINSSYACPRLHQLLYNDIVEVIKDTNDEVCISISQAYYLIPSSSTPSSSAKAKFIQSSVEGADKQTHYWTLKKNITFLDDLNVCNIPTHHLPDPITFSDSMHTALTQNNIITLIEPYYDPILRITFSVGTRFMQVPLSSKKRSSYVYAFAINHETHKEQQIKIPLSKCVIGDNIKTPMSRINDYVALLKKWTHTKTGCIPYTWGGTSFAHTTSGNFKEITRKTNNGDYSLYDYEKNNHCPKNGFDCSGVIARATQICGIPYFCKNTTTIPHGLISLKSDQIIAAGDLILIKGHVMVVSDIKKNLLIEARSYSHGYGKLQEIELKKVFEGIETYQDLMNAYNNKVVIKRKDKQGKVRDTFTNLQLFSMISAFKSAS